MLGVDDQNTKNGPEASPAGVSVMFSAAVL